MDTSTTISKRGKPARQMKHLTIGCLIFPRMDQIEDAGCSDTRRDHGSTQEIARTSSNSGRTGCLHRFTPWRTDWASMGRCGFREPRYSRSPFGCDDGSRHSQDRSFSKRCASRRRSCRISPQVATDQLIQPRNRLGFCFAHKEGEATALARHSRRRYGKPAVKAAEIKKRVAFHTFRHTYTTLLTQNSEDVKVVQELPRHANSRVTLDLYAQAGMQEKREAQSKLVRLVLNKGEALA